MHYHKYYYAAINVMSRDTWERLIEINRLLTFGIYLRINYAKETMISLSMKITIISSGRFHARIFTSYEPEYPFVLF